MKVAVGIITDKNQNILITRRALDISYGGYWEFPGGKLEQDEDPQQALIREIHEEVGLTVKASKFLGEVKHFYSSKMITLYIFHVSYFTGVAQCCEQQMELLWIPITTIDQYKFPEANKKIVELFSRSNACQV